MDSVEVDGLRIAYRRAGAGQPLVLVHGAVCDSRVWADQLDDLSADFTVVAWDAPGCGGSSDPPDSFRLPDYADALAGFVAALGLRRPHVLGHSFGGALAIELHHRHAEVVRSLLLVSAYAGWAGSLPPEVVDARVAFALGAAEQLSTPSPGSTPDMFDDLIPPARQQELIAMMRDVRPTAIRAMALGLAEADLRQCLPRIDVPTLLLYGDADERAPRAVADQLHAAIPNSTLVMLPGLGHELYLEDPAAFERELRAFLG